MTIIRVAIMPAIFHRCITLAASLRMGQLLSVEGGASDGFTDVDCDLIAFKADGIDVQRSWCRRFEYPAGDVKHRGMAGAFKLFSFSDPGDSAAKMGAFSGNSQKATIVQVTEVEVSMGYECDRTGREVTELANLDNLILVCC